MATTTTQEHAIDKVALIEGAACSLGHAIALELMHNGVRVMVSDRVSRSRNLESLTAKLRTAGTVEIADRGAGAPAQQAHAAFGRLDYIVNLLVPDPAIEPAELYQFPLAFLGSVLEASELLSSNGSHAAVINQCFLPSAFAGTRFEDCMPAIKGAMTGITRTLCRRFGRRGTTVNCIQTGLIDMPELREILHPTVAKLKVPIGRWGTPDDVAKMVIFLALRNRYWTGQSIIMDGGLTSGITGT
jgi:3-oxoacyl-[acyl-carrier protein] reductase